MSDSVWICHAKVNVIAVTLLHGVSILQKKRIMIEGLQVLIKIKLYNERVIYTPISILCPATPKCMICMVVSNKSVTENTSINAGSTGKPNWVHNKRVCVCPTYGIVIWSNGSNFQQVYHVTVLPCQLWCKLCGHNTATPYHLYPRPAHVQQGRSDHGQLHVCYVSVFPTLVQSARFIDCVTHSARA